MNIKDAYDAAVRLQAKIANNSIIMSGFQGNNKSVGRPWSVAFVNLFEGLDFEERKLLREIGRYQTLLEVYDISKEELSPTVFVVQKASQALNSVNAYVQANAPFVKGVKTNELLDSVEITFPISSLDSTTFELSAEIDWFFKVFNRVSAEFSDNDSPPVIVSIDNIDLSIAVAIDWKFLLVIILVWTRIQKNYTDNREIKSAIDLLIKKGLDDKKAGELEKEFDKQADQLIEEVRKDYEEIAGENGKEGWQSSFTKFAHHLFKAKDRGYRLEFMAGRDNKGGLLPGRPPAFLETIQRLSYTRENDSSGAGRTELLGKPKAESIAESPPQ